MQKREEGWKELFGAQEKPRQKKEWKKDGGGYQGSINGIFRSARGSGGQENVLLSPKVEKGGD